MKVPKVSVVMPVYNGMPYLPRALDSILEQSFTDFELIVVNDCSTDNSKEYIKSLTDDRIVFVDLKENQGVTGALRAGLEKVRGEYIARLDADDEARPERLSKQVEFLDEHPEIGICGSSFYLIGEDEKVDKKEINIGKNDLEIRWKALFKNPFVHSTVMIRRSILVAFDLNYTQKHGEDYALWLAILKHSKGHILSEPLIYYRMHPNNWTTKKKEQQDSASAIISSKLLNDLVDTAEIDPAKFGLWVRGHVQVPREQESLFAKLYARLLNAFMKKNPGAEKNYQFAYSKLRLLRSRISAKSFFVPGILNLYIKSSIFRYL